VQHHAKPKERVVHVNPHHLATVNLSLVIVLVHQIFNAVSLKVPEVVVVVAVANLKGVYAEVMHVPLSDQLKAIAIRVIQ
jgi:hypothetical protein